MRSPFCFISTSPRVVTLDMTRRPAFQLGDLAAPEVPMLELGMRNDQIRLAHGARSVADNVEIEGARAPPLSGRTVASPLRFNRMAMLQQIDWAQGRFHQHHLIQIGSLRYRPERRRFFHLRCCNQPCPGQRPETAPGVCEMRGAVADVRAERDIRVFCLRICHERNATAGGGGTLRWRSRAARHAATRRPAPRPPPPPPGPVNPPPPASRPAP